MLVRGELVWLTPTPDPKRDSSSCQHELLVVRNLSMNRAAPPRGAVLSTTCAPQRTAARLGTAKRNVAGQTLCELGDCETALRAASPNKRCCSELKGRKFFGKAPYIRWLLLGLFLDAEFK